MARASAQNLNANADTWLPLEDTAEFNWDKTGYKSTYPIPEDGIDDYHRALGDAKLLPDGNFIDLNITGWLLRADAQKLYELAYYADDVLELGTCCGLSACVILHAIHNSGRPRTFATVDLDPTIQDSARWGLNKEDVPGRERVHYFRSDATAFLQALIAKRPMGLSDRLLRRRKSGLDALPKTFSLVFIDHSHAYDAVRSVCELLHKVVQPGGFALFHDYNDQRNIMPDVADYGVFQGVRDGLAPGQFEFYGVFGCAGLFRRTPQLTS